MKENEIIIFENQEVKLEVNLKDETVWLTQEQISILFNKERSVITKHLKNIFKEELEENSNVQKMHIPKSDKPVTFYNLDVIISVGYRVKSKQGIAFRKWASKILKDYMLKGYAINEQRLNYLEKKVQILDIVTRSIDNIKDTDLKQVIKVISNYTKGLDLLDDYDHRTLKKVEGTKSEEKIAYKECINIINTLKFNEQSNIFALERDKGLESIINNIYQTWNREDIYQTIEEKAANFLYMVVKNHVFIDGNKRIAATLFIYFLQFYNILYQNNIPIIDNNTLASLTILIAESNPKEKEVMVNLIMNIISK
ncbi:MAG: phosphoribosylaminoimidazolesuccinocarboxamide synthase [Firmicutes bacterium]|nr:phosphoribosylaminoimidazolesuccinocarboxamide synthase [Bacillota bacterium]